MRKGRLIRKHNPYLRENAQNLRRNMTPEERHLWYDFLKKLPLTVHRQKTIGDYVVDFYIASSNIVIELDGHQHDFEGYRKADHKRDDILRMAGITVLRYRNDEVRENFHGVCEDILDKLGLRE